MTIRTFVLLLLSLFLITACIRPKINLFPDYSEPLKEYTLEGKEKGKVLVVPVRGFISDSPRGLMYRSKPSLVEEVASKLKKAQDDKEIRAVVLEVNSPGGSITATDVLYHEILSFKRRSKAKIVAAMMDVAASGGYYISLPSDYIFAHPTSVTGSVGVIFIRPKVFGLMDKIGLSVEVSKSGVNKDMGSPFRESTEEEERILRGVIEDLGGRFERLVAKWRKIDREKLAAISTGRIYLADEALKVGMIDEIGYLDDALKKAKELAGLPEDSKVVVYRRKEYSDDTIYNTSTAAVPDLAPSLLGSSIFQTLAPLETGFYYLWLPAEVVR